MIFFAETHATPTGNSATTILASNLFTVHHAHTQTRLHERNSSLTVNCSLIQLSEGCLETRYKYLETCSQRLQTLYNCLCKQYNSLGTQKTRLGKKKKRLGE